MNEAPYKVSVTWMQNREGTAQTAGVRERLFFSAPPEFGGQPGLWSPEALLVLAAASCYLSTFLFFIEREGLKLIAYHADAEGRLERVPGTGFRFAEIVLRPLVVVESEEAVAVARRQFEKAERACIVSNSLQTPVRVEAQVEALVPALKA
jgi:peroxiredoxin-like protein